MKKVAVFMAVILCINLFPEGAAAWENEISNFNEIFETDSDDEDNDEDFAEEGEDFTDNEDFTDDEEFNQRDNKENEDEDESDLLNTELTSFDFFSAGWETTGFIESESDLLEFLNLGGETNRDVDYEIKEDITINAGDLLWDDFNKFLMLSNLYGGGKTITINVDNDKKSRPLFYIINAAESGSGITIDNPIEIKDLNIVINGDTEVSAFCFEYLGWGNYENIKITVNGDIVACYPRVGFKGNNFGGRGVANGFADQIGATEGLTNIKNIHISANTIGQTDKTDATGTQAVAGFANRIGMYGVGNSRQVNVDGVYLTYDSFNAVSDRGVVMSGFANMMASDFQNNTGEVRKNIRVTVENDMKAEVSGLSEKYGIHYVTDYVNCGIYGISGYCNLLADSSVTVKGDMIYRGNTGRQVGEDYVYLGGLIKQEGGSDKSENIVSGNTVEIGGMYGYTSHMLSMSGGILGSPLVGNGVNNTVYSKNNCIDVGSMYGESEGLYEKSNVYIAGFNFRSLRESISDKAVIGSIEALNKNGNVIIDGFGESVHKQYFVPMINEDISLHIKGDLKGTAFGGKAVVSGFSYGSMAENYEGVSIEIDGDISAYSDTTNAYASGYSALLLEDGELKNSRIIVHGDISAESGQGSATAAGGVALLEGLAESNGLYVGGDIGAEGGAVSFGSGFAKEVGDSGQAADNAVFVKGKVSGINSTGEGYGTAFAYNANGVVKDNATFVFQGTYSHDFDTRNEDLKNNFIKLAQSNGEITGNTLFGKAGTGVDYKKFIDEVQGANVDGNFFTSMIKGQRAVNLLTQNGTAFEIKDEAVYPANTTIEVSNKTDYTDGKTYITDDRLNTGLSLSGVSGTVFQGSSSIKADNAISLAILRGNSGEALDIVGLGHVNEENYIKGTVWEGNCQGALLANVQIDLKYNGKLLNSVQTDGSGLFSIPVPLYCTTELDYELVIHALPQYEVISHGDSAFFPISKSMGTLTEKIYYENDQIFNGILKKTGDDSNLFKVTYHPAGGSGTAYVDQIESADAPRYVLLGSDRAGFSRKGYDFKGWSLTEGAEKADFQGGDSYAVTRDMNFYAVWSLTDSTGGGGSSSGRDKDSEIYTVTFMMNDGTKDVYLNKNVSKGSKVTEPKAPERFGYEFTGWYLEADCENLYNFEEKVMESFKLYGGWREMKIFTDEHFAYVAGYPDGTVHPENNITRAEAAAVIFRLMDADYKSSLTAVSDKYSDVNSNSWYGTSVAAMTGANIFHGYPDGTFKPDNHITRGEFAKVIAGFLGGEYNGGDKFRDIENHWAADYINLAAHKGWIAGYPNNTYLPDSFITRAETVSIMNRILDRNPESAEDLLQEMIVWPDNSDDSKWYYVDIQEATNGHLYKRKDSDFEIWEALYN